MVVYEATVYTGDRIQATTLNSVHIKLVGTDGESDRTWLKSLVIFRGSVSTYTVSCPNSLGRLLLIELDKRQFGFLPDDAWFPDKVEIKSPEEDIYTFPIHCWISDQETHRYREGKALRIFDESHSLGQYARQQELSQRSVDYDWEFYGPGMPYTIKADGAMTLPDEVQFSFTKTTEFAFTAATGLAELRLKGLVDNQDNWKTLDDINDVFRNKDTPLSDYVQDHWAEDWLFAYQFLNGVNPTLIRRCKTLPENFPVTDDMVFIPDGSNLLNELERGNIYLCDYKNLDGIPANIIEEKQQYLTAPLVLLHKRSDDKLMPIAIQLKQTPAEDNPIFLPTDSAYDWLTAKIFVRSADFSEHQLNAHLLRTHLLAEVFAVSLLRNLPMVHPIYKLLIPHTRYTLQINELARQQLIGPAGVFTMFAASGREALPKILARSLSSITYRSLCIPDDIADRDLRDLPNFYYRDDGLQLWNIIFEYVQRVIKYYYKSDDEVQRDSELQIWIGDIFKHGFLSQLQTGIPQNFTTVSELIKFATMVMFTCSCQHAAVNSGQYDYGGWMPNTPTTLQRAPPTKKGTTSKSTILETLPPINVTAQGMASAWLLSQPSSDFVPLGHYPEEHFTEEIPRQLQKDFKAELDELSIKINNRNEGLEISVTMLHYEVTVYTGHRVCSGTLNHVHMKLVGKDGESHRTSLSSLRIASGSVSTYTISCPRSLGELVLIELDKQHGCLMPDDAWFPNKVEIKSPEGVIYTFPIHCWIGDKETHRFREGKALRVFDETNSLGQYAREQELCRRKADYGWEEAYQGVPHCIEADGPCKLPHEVQFSFTKNTEFEFTAIAALTELELKRLEHDHHNWKHLDDIKHVFCNKHTVLSDYVQEHWTEDWLFGYQFLNGNHPTLIQRCKTLPENFPVTDDMVVISDCSNLSNELKQGNIYLCDYKNLDGMPGNIIRGVQQYLTAPLVLFHKQPDDKLIPIAIQLKQTPSHDNPIFLPTDSEYDWLTAKIFVKSADFTEHQLNAHLLRTHLLAEVFAVSLLRKMPMVHPIYKLLIPHTRYTLHINELARTQLIGPAGIFTQFAASGGPTMFKILERSLSSITYRSLCFPDDIADRDLQDVPNFYYRDDGLKLWNIIFKFVQGMIQYYYKSDEQVQQDSELQIWIGDIFEHGFLCQQQTGMPQSFTTVPELVKFATMVIFTCSCQHAAVNNGQYDYGAWMPNTPITLQRAPPTKKGTTSKATILKTLPPINVTVQGMAAVWLLSRQSSDFVPLGHYPEDHFTEGTPRQMQKDFKSELDQLSIKINERNKSLKIPYTYLDPKNVENSVAI
ncbi:polyunsaturated fatty acid lipoxygenase ALOX15B-like isoform 3-T3 [Syngnathus typhle]